MAQFSLDLGDVLSSDLDSGTVLRLTFSRPTRDVPFFSFEQQVRAILKPAISDKFLIKNVQETPENVVIMLEVKPDTHIAAETKQARIAPIAILGQFLISFGIFAGITTVLLYVFGMQLEKVEKIINTPIGGIIAITVGLVALGFAVPKLKKGFS